MSDYKIGEEIYIHGYVDEIRKDVVIIRNEGGYFGTVPSEIKPSAEKIGHWIELDGSDPYYYMCSECHRRVDEQETYCPSCWARMVGSQAESEE